jgi:cell division septation protein DedD
MTKACAVMLMVVAMLGGCSREKIDWKSAEAADTVESYDHFIERHPDSELATKAHARVAQLNEERDWRRASTTDTADAYRQFLAQHESGKWAEEARIRVENFALDGTAAGPARPTTELNAATGSAEPKPGSYGPRADATPSATAQAPATRDVPPPTSSKPAATAAPKSVAQATPTPPTAPARTASAHSPAPSPAPTKSPTTPAAAAEAPAPFGIQLGAFHSQEAALANWKALQSKFDADLHGLFARAVPVSQSAGQLFRLQAPVGDESRARSICASLTRKSQPCVVVLPQPH